ncbi:hypothetical protein J2X14_000994 [Pantoea alhagi]|uniref:hypothetical protein n=1 Tax=Mixta sp. BE291 TaxID=3158787 RepID=UPI00286230E2|nr:hypothetical protein [Pantoea alhagi]
MFVANTTSGNIIATRYAQLNRDDSGTGDSKIAHELKNVKNDNEAVLKKHNFLDKVKTFPKRIFNYIKKVICLGRYDSKDLEFSTTATKNLKAQTLEKQQEKGISDNQIALKILVDQLRKNKPALKTIGLFRKAANTNKLDKLMKDMNKPGQPWIVSPKTDILVICDAIKRVMEKSITKEEQGRFSGFKQVFLEKGTLPPLKDLPEAYRIIQPLMEDMLAVAEENKMNAHNLAIVIAPRFFTDTTGQLAEITDKPMTDEERKNEIDAQMAKSNEKNKFFEALLVEYCQNKKENVSHESAA